MLILAALACTGTESTPAPPPEPTEAPVPPPPEKAAVDATAAAMLKALPERRHRRTRYPPKAAPPARR